MIIPIKIKQLILLILLLMIDIYSSAQGKAIFIINHFPEGKAGTEKSIFLAGTFNNWNPADTAFRFKRNNNRYELSVFLPSIINEFKITRGSWDQVECTINGQAVKNHIIKVKKDTLIYLSVAQWQDSFETKPKLHTASKQVKIIDTAFYIPQLDRKRRVWIYLPEGYENSKKSYPVIYMHDGQNIFDNYTSGYGEWGVDEVLDSLNNIKKPMAIVVGIDHGNENRFTEYNPYLNEHYGKGRGDDYVDFLAKTLKPFIDKNYRTLADVKNTTVAGSSMGGLISLYALAKYSKTFGAAGVFSPAFWISPELFNYISSKKLASSRIYFVAGGLERDTMVPDMLRMYEILLKKGLSPKNLYSKVWDDGAHNEWFWRREFPHFYNWISK
ncbi:MAG: alpha/beta hydrolase-fold protein [Daejeonella sp.]